MRPPNTGIFNEYGIKNIHNITATSYQVNAAAAAVTNRVEPQNNDIYLTDIIYRQYEFKLERKMN